MFGFFKKQKKETQDIPKRKYDTPDGLVEHVKLSLKWQHPGVYSMACVSNLAKDVMKYYGRFNNEDKKLFNPLLSCDTDFEIMFSKIVAFIILDNDFHFSDKIELIEQVYFKNEAPNITKQKLDTIHRIMMSVDEIIEHFGGSYDTYGSYTITNLTDFLNHEKIKLYYFVYVASHTYKICGVNRGLEQWYRIPEEIRYDPQHIKALLSFKKESRPNINAHYRLLKSMLNDPRVNYSFEELDELLECDVYMNTLLFIINYEKFGVSQDNKYVNLTTEEDITRSINEFSRSYNSLENAERMLEDFTAKRVKNNILEAIGETENFEIKKRRM